MMKRWWVSHRERLTIGLITLMFLGKSMVALGIGILLADWLRPWAGYSIVFGIALDALAKWRWMRRR